MFLLLFARDQHARWIEALAYLAVVQDLEAQRVDELRHALLHLTSPKGRGDFSQHLVKSVENGGILPDQHQRQLALGAENATELVERAHNVVSGQEFEKIAAENRVEGVAGKRHMSSVNGLTMRLGGRKT